MLVSYYHYFYIQFELLGPCFKTGWLGSPISGTFCFVCFFGHSSGFSSNHHPLRNNYPLSEPEFGLLKPFPPWGSTQFQWLSVSFFFGKSQPHKRDKWRQMLRSLKKEKKSSQVELNHTDCSTSTTPPVSSRLDILSLSMFTFFFFVHCCDTVSNETVLLSGYFVLNLWQIRRHVSVMKAFCENGSSPHACECKMFISFF